MNKKTFLSAGNVIHIKSACWSANALGQKKSYYRKVISSISEQSMSKQNDGGKGSWLSMVCLFFLTSNEAQSPINR